MRNIRKAQNILMKNLKRRDHSADLGADGTSILNYILQKWGVKWWNERSWLRIQVVGSSGQVTSLRVAFQMGISCP
jgi:hypothetical protein